MEEGNVGVIIEFLLHFSPVIILLVYAVLLVKLLNRQEKAHEQLLFIIHELRRSNRLLEELAGDVIEEPDSLTQMASNNKAALFDRQHKLYVGNIDYAATESELADYFSQYGQVEFVNIPINRYSNKTRGFGFVTFVSKEDAKRAMALHGTEFKGRKIQVNFAKEREVAL